MTDLKKLAEVRRRYKYCPDNKECPGECYESCAKGIEQREFWTGVGGWVCPYHGLGYGGCASCELEREDQWERDYKQSLRNDIARLEGKCAVLAQEVETLREQLSQARQETLEEAARRVEIASPVDMGSLADTIRALKQEAK